MTRLAIRHETKRCVRCRKAAVMWCGHVKDTDGRDVLAGWCSQDCMDRWRACVGHYLPWMGKANV